MAKRGRPKDVTYSVSAELVGIRLDMANSGTRFTHEQIERIVTALGGRMVSSEIGCIVRIPIPHQGYADQVASLQKDLFRGYPRLDMNIRIVRDKL